MPQWLDTTIGKVRIEKQLAQGGMAEVYLGTHLTLDRPVAIKVMHSYVESDEEMKMRFQREAKVVAALRHPNIVQIYDFDTADGHPYIVMEYIRGPSLAAYLKNLHERNERMQPQHIARLMSKLANALDYAHEQGVIHRDIKPGNILLHVKAGESRSMFTDQIEPIITDFGLVRIIHATTQTASGLVSGTPAYISPEQAQGLKVDHRTDIYSFGVILYEILAGRVPFDADSTWSVIYKHIHEAPPSIPNAQAAIQKVIERAEAKVSAAPLASPRRTWVPLLGVGVLVLALGAFGISRLFAATPTNQLPTPTQLPTTGMEMPGEIYNSTANPGAEAAAPIGVLRFQDGTAPADEVTLNTSGMPLPPAGSQYEAWLVEEDAEQRVSLGILKFDSEGNGSLSYVDPQGRNLLGTYQGLEITVEPSPDNNPNPSNTVAYSTVLPSGGFTHVRHLLYSFPATPDKIGLVDGLMRDTALVNTLAQEMLSNYQSGDEASVRARAEAMLNIIVGKQSENYKDWDTDGEIKDPGDGFGLLLNGDSIGYIQGTYTHADLAMKAPDATQNMKVHGDHVKISATNVSGWTTTLRDQLILILQTPFGPEMEGMVRNAVALANHIENGVDVNGNENIEPIPGEGGAKTAYDHAYYMADMLIPAASNSTPTP